MNLLPSLNVRSSKKTNESPNTGTRESFGRGVGTPLLRIVITKPLIETQIAGPPPCRDPEFSYYLVRKLTYYPLTPLLMTIIHKGPNIIIKLRYDVYYSDQYHSQEQI